MQKLSLIISFAGEKKNSGMESREIYIGLYPIPPPKKSSTGYPNCPRASDKFKNINKIFVFIIIRFPVDRTIYVPSFKLTKNLLKIINIYI